jgi:5-methylcytosine-specific restriction endonuclease McrA
MPQRACLLCPHPAMPGASRCSKHKGKARGPRRHDANHDRLAKQVKAKASTCAICGLPGTPTDPLEAGHIIPLSRGGQTVIGNYRAEHRSHNRAEGARLARGGLRFSP